MSFFHSDHSADIPSKPQRRYLPSLLALCNSASNTHITDMSDSVFFDDYMRRIWILVSSLHMPSRITSSRGYFTDCVHAVLGGGISDLHDLTCIYSICVSYIAEANRRIVDIDSDAAARSYAQYIISHLFAALQIAHDRHIPPLCSIFAADMQKDDVERHAEYLANEHMTVDMAADMLSLQSYHPVQLASPSNIGKNRGEYDDDIQCALLYSDFI